MVIMVSIIEKERYSYFRYPFGNSLKSVTRKNLDADEIHSLKRSVIY